jgi:hypothetical protein
MSKVVRISSVIIAHQTSGVKVQTENPYDFLPFSTSSGFSIPPMLKRLANTGMCDHLMRCARLTKVNIIACSRSQIEHVCIRFCDRNLPHSANCGAWERSKILVFCWSFWLPSENESDLKTLSAVATEPSS